MAVAVACIIGALQILFWFCIVENKIVISDHQQQPQQQDHDLNHHVASVVRRVEHSNDSKDSSLAGSMRKRRQQITTQQEEQFDRSRPIYVDFGLSDAADTAHHLSMGYSVVAVDAFLPWIVKAKEKFVNELQSHRL